MRFMLLLYVPERPAPGSPEQGNFFFDIMAFHEECRARGVLVSSDPLAAPDTATTIRVREGRTLSTDGPFAETKEWLGGYFLLDCRDLGEALELAAACPTARNGSVEVRPVLDIPRDSPVS